MKSQHLSLDIINTLPQTITENILCLVPIHEAARTSILSKEWRYKWTKIPKLEFDENTFEESTEENQVSSMKRNFQYLSQRTEMSQRCKLFYAIFQVLLAHEAPILELSLSMHADESCAEIEQIINHLAKKSTVKKLTLELGREYLLPLSVFSLHHLTDLYLNHCYLGLETTFSGFDNLTTLRLEDVDISKETLIHLVSKCPLLKNFSLLAEYYNISGNVNSTLIELLGCLRVVECLAIYLWGFECFVPVVYPRELPTSLVHLKCVDLFEMSFKEKDWLDFLALLFRSAPNLEKVKLWMVTNVKSWTWFLNKFEKVSDAADDGGDYYANIRLENLKELEIVNFGNWKHDIKFVKLVLAKSSVLKKVKMILNDKVSKDEELETQGILLCSLHASPVVEIIFERHI